MTKNVNVYGNAPYSVVVVHGGPGAPGGMAPVARELSSTCGTLEPLQTAMSVEGQIRELHELLQEYGSTPVTLIGHSWGVWLSYFVAARYPQSVKKLILVGSGPFEEKYVSRIVETRMGRLSAKERTRFHEIMKALDDPDNRDKTLLFELGDLISRTDHSDPMPSTDERVEVQQNIFQSVWQEAKELRKSGELLEIGRSIECPVIALHGDHDPHPFEGVEKPLSHTLMDFRFVLLERCGHEPWIEKHASNRFYRIVKRELME